MKLCSGILVAMAALTLASGAVAQTARPSLPLRAGAAKVDVTPSAGELPKNSQGVLDRLFARAIVLESGGSSAALVTVDAGGVPDPIWQAVTRDVEKELGIPATRVLLTATHTHSA